MPKTRKTVQPKNLAKYDVYVEDSNPISEYFQITNLPQVFTGGRNSFLIAGSPYLQNLSNILVEILDANGLPIYQNPVPKYIEGKSRLLSVEISETTTPGYATIILLGCAKYTVDNQPVPSNWENKYNVRWVTKVLVEPNARNKSPLVFLNEPTIFSEEKRFHNVTTASFNSINSFITTSLTPILYSGFVKGYLLSVTSPTSFSSEHFGGVVTGSLTINNKTTEVYLPITNILNSTTAYSEGYVIKNSNGNIIDKILLYSGSYTTTVLNNITDVTSSVSLLYNNLNTVKVNVPISYAKLRVANLNTVSGEIYKTKIYAKVSTNIQDYKLVADIKVDTNELLVTSSIRGDLPIGDFNLSPTASTNWYSYSLETSSNAIYPISGSLEYYNPTTTITSYSLSVTDDVLLRSIRANVPIHNNEKFANSVSESGYFIGTKQSLGLFPTTEYTLQLNAYYKKSSGSVNLMGNTPSVDIYIIGVDTVPIVSNDPLGQKIGQLSVIGNTDIQYFEKQQFNFTPQLPTYGDVGLRFVVKNGFWNFADISLKPASDKLFSPDEIQLLVPNTEYYNEYLEHKIEFFDINNNSTDVSISSLPTFFTGSVIDLGTLP